jgi:hypothetical protein
MCAGTPYFWSVDTGQNLSILNNFTPPQTYKHVCMRTFTCAQKYSKWVKKSHSLLADFKSKVEVKWQWKRLIPYGNTFIIQEPQIQGQVYIQGQETLGHGMTLLLKISICYSQYFWLSYNILNAH